MKKFCRRKTTIKIAGLGILLCCLGSARGWAVVGQAEQYSEFRQEDLDQFQRSLLKEEREQQLSQLQMRKNFEMTSGQKTEGLDRQLQEMQRELLTLPKRKLVQFEASGVHVYDSNSIRAVPRQEKDDSYFDTYGATLFNFSGKKTDLRFEVNGGKHWSVEFPEGDNWTAGERIRYRRKYFKKLQHSFQSAIARSSSKSIELNANKIRWDSNQDTSYNYPITKKISANLGITSVMRTFTQEAYDQDSSWEIATAPSLFYNFTPKTRFSLGYRIGTNDIRSKAGNTNSHQIHAGYFGRITRKSSASLDVSYDHQTPKSLESPTSNTYTVGVGYIWQMTGKSQVALQAIHSMQNTSSDLVSGNPNDDDSTTTKNDSRITNQSISASLNSRLSSRLSAIVTLNLSHTNTGVLKGANKDAERTQYTFPVNVGLTYSLRRWAVLTFNYTFSYRGGYEKSDRYRDHLVSSMLRLLI